MIGTKWTFDNVISPETYRDFAEKWIGCGVKFIGVAAALMLIILASYLRPLFTECTASSQIDNHGLPFPSPAPPWPEAKKTFTK